MSAVAQKAAETPVIQSYEIHSRNYVPTFSTNFVRTQVNNFTAIIYKLHYEEVQTNHAGVGLAHCEHF